ncbi:MAG: hypothetical protein LBT42_09810 [Tannerella sp.]|nr:hypothetical protein [Tannerella sp.]
MKDQKRQKIYLFCLVMAFGGFLQPAELSAQNEVKKNISLANVTVNELVEKLGHEFPYSFFVTDPEVAKTRVSVNVNNATAEQVLTNAFAGKELFFTKKDKSFTIAAKTASNSVQPANKKRITGAVLDDTGEPVIGASVVEKGSPTNGTATDVDGKFTLTVENVGGGVKCC